MINILPISSSNLISLSAEYKYDDNIVFKSTQIKWKDGYITHVHDFFNASDISLNNNTIFYLNTSCNLLDFIKENQNIANYTGSFISIIFENENFVPNVQYMSVSGTNLLLLGTSSDDSFFRLIVNDNNSISLYKDNGYYVTVTEKNPYNLYLAYEFPNEEKYKQEFYLHTIDNENAYMTVIIESENGTEERIISYSQSGPHKGKMRANGLLNVNNYTFKISNFDIYFTSTGLINNHSWVRYYNEFDNLSNNKNVEIKTSESLSSIPLNHLFNLNYNSDINISNNKMYLDFLNLKNIKNSFYEYGVKK